MFFLEYIVFLLIILFTHLIAITTQKLSSHKYLFGVYVGQIMIPEDFDIKIRKDFKKKLNISLIISIVIYVIFKNILNFNIAKDIVISTTIYLSIFFFILKNEYDKVKVFKNSYIKKNNLNLEKDYEVQLLKENEILTQRKKKIIKKFKILFGLCICISLASLFYVIINYENIPDIMITHWGAGGKADGYSHKNIFTVFFMNFIDIGMVILFVFIGIGSITSDTYIDTENLDENIKKAIKYLNGLGYSTFILTLSIQSITSTIPIFMIKQKNFPLWLSISSLITPIVISIFLIYYYMMLDSLKPKGKNGYTIENDDEKWIYGFIYYNKEDPRVMVDKRFGMGWNINMATFTGKFIFLNILLILIGSIVISFVL